MSKPCYRKGFERGLWFELKAITEVIAAKKARGEDASFERELLKAYRKCTETDYERLLKWDSNHDSQQFYKAIKLKD